MESGEQGIMKKKPRHPDEPIVDKKMGLALGFQSIGLTIAALLAFAIGYYILPNQDIIEVGCEWY